MADTAAAAAVATTLAAADTSASATHGSSYRGKCLYKTGKCPNERALKTSGAAHNLCDEHRRRQNEHQRKLDTKNRFSRKDKRVGGSTRAAEDAEAATEGLAPLSAEATKRYEQANVKHDASASAVEADAAAATVVAAPLPATPGSSMLSVGSAANALPTRQPLMREDAAGKPYGPAGAQPTHAAYPYVVPDFDGIMVPLPSCFEGHERAAVRARVHQKVLDFISEECIRVFSSKALAGASAALLSPPQQHAIYQSKGTRSSERALGTDGASLSDGDDAHNGATDRESEPRVTKKLRASTTPRSVRDRPGKHPRGDM